MRYSGKIKELNDIVISDPSYNKDVTCRYERNNLNKKNWIIDIDINHLKTPVSDNITLEGTEFFILLHPKDKTSELKGNGTISYLSAHKLNEIDIGMDTACIALGINDFAKDINESANFWQPECSLNTLTDGMFGTVKEGIIGNQPNFIWISGYLDADTGYSIQDIIDYLESQFQIVDLKYDYEKTYMLKENVLLEKMSELTKSFKEITKEDKNLLEYFKQDDPPYRFTSIMVAGTVIAGINLRNLQRKEKNLEGKLEKSPFSDEQEKMIDEYSNLRNELDALEREYEMDFDYDKD